ncbi:phospholipase D-like domain-containing protein [Paenibacillus polysaccharolyticus]|uniref:phospholipase D-like domain-containing protein n=1 Tax=Paenibacillus polysaccharolyticus TaxID=582692 RepID=UPI0020417F9E|nr:phospholipase D-like domain-containing protein [Paenibacillus polysaccharolyticus]MCM3131215.1 phospholipase D-like domain-containing protein [Paenibacillus polysaccharolyticus]
MSYQKFSLIPGQIDIVTSKGESNYQEVLNDFDSADYIFVTTYNISQNRKALLSSLKGAAAHAEVRIVTNIPNRYETYYGDNVRKKASESINNYTKKLNSNDNEESIGAFFNFQNHSKVILTNNIAYIGSANFSEESNNNRETGFIIRDRSLIQVVIDNLVPIILDESIRYYGNSFEEKKLVLSLLASRLESASIKIEEESYTYVGRFEEVKTYNHWDPQLRQESLEGLLELLEEIEDEIYRINELYETDEFADLIDSDSIEQIKILCSEDDNISELASFNENHYASDLIAEWNVHNDDMDEAAQRASDQTFERKQELAEAAQQDIESLFLNIQRIQNSFELIIRKLEELEDEQETNIDNT